jgi:transposase-like protein
MTRGTPESPEERSRGKAPAKTALSVRRRSPTSLPVLPLCLRGTLGITTEGVKVPVGLWEGSTENATVATALLSDLVERGLDPQQGMLFVIDGSKALRKAIRDVFGEAAIQRCIRHKERNVLEHLPERDRAVVKRRLRQAWALEDHHETQAVTVLGFMSIAAVRVGR